MTNIDDLNGAGWIGLSESERDAARKAPPLPDYARVPTMLAIEQTTPPEPELPILPVYPRWLRILLFIVLSCGAWTLVAGVVAVAWLMML